MQTEQRRWQAQGGFTAATAGFAGEKASLVFVFGGRSALASEPWLAATRERYPNARIVGCSTAGEILREEVTDDSIVTTAVCFGSTRVDVETVHVDGPSESAEAGARLAKSFDPKGLAHVLVFSDGQRVNGSELVAGLTANLPASVAVTGGLAGDGARFERTLVIGDDGPAEGRILAVGFYGEKLRVGFGSLGGWDPYGPERLVTKATGNVLAELDGQPALALYKRYLGEHAAGLPSTALLFPLSVRMPDGRTFVRTILGVDEKKQSLTFAGDVPMGAYARLMKANFDRLVDGAHGAAEQSGAAIGTGQNAGLALLISCVGRKLVLKQRTEEEVEAVREVLGPSAAITGFYSYGEICPAAPNAGCELHNQTMTITTISES